MFNSGQSCCAVERIYVHSSIYDEFIKKFVEVAKAYKLGDPMDKSTTLGPVVSLASAARIRKQVQDAVAAGAQLVLDESHFPEAKEGSTLVGPQVLVNVDHSESSHTGRHVSRLTSSDGDHDGRDVRTGYRDHES